MARSHNEEPLVAIATFETEIEASFARGALEVIGIRALVPGEHGGSFTGLYSGGPPRAAQLLVFESDRDRAITELERLQLRIVPPRHRV
jgi:hypothetical protein